MHGDWTAGSPRSRKVITAAGWGFATVWISLIVASGILERSVIVDLFEQSRLVSLYGLGPASNSENPFLVRLFAHAFVHDPLRLAVNLFLLYRLVLIARELLTPQDLVRLYTLGTVISGLTYLLISKQLGNTIPLWGATGGLMACFSMISVLHPGEPLFGRVPRNWFAIGLQTACCLAIALGFNYWSHHATVTPEDAHLLPMGIGTNLAALAGLVAGVVYGLVEKIRLSISPIAATQE